MGSGSSLMWLCGQARHACAVQPHAGWGGGQHSQLQLDGHLAAVWWGNSQACVSSGTTGRPHTTYHSFHISVRNLSIPFWGLQRNIGIKVVLM